MEVTGLGRPWIMEAKPTLGGVHHVGIVVADRDRSLEYLGTMFGVEGWSVPDVDTAELTDSSTTPDLRVSVGVLRLDNLFLEIIQPLDHESPHGAFLTERGEGLHHLAFQVPVLGEPIGRFVNTDCSIVYDKTSPDSPARTASLGGGPLDGVFVELMEQSPAVDQFWGTLKKLTSGQ
ncbi:VOC family protein [Amycolatopsis sp. GM8]|uniref:VOC family protein n=1 Tax=Amycolatopsis sp. GM8 TaxID=2896530 RepID=UPI001F27FE5F|nr:VOC family protein [Amycolatopsis sp. GM8]